MRGERRREKEHELFNIKQNSFLTFSRKYGRLWRVQLDRFAKTHTRSLITVICAQETQYRSSATARKERM